ncbi:MAG: MFS transporter [Stackebrandtia sp.]
MTSPSRRWWALAALVACAVVVDLDTTILNVAVPSFAEQLHADTGQIQWILNAYTIVMAALFIPAGLLADRLGRKRILLAAMVCFGAGSLIGAFAPNIVILFAARAMMGAGAAAILPLTMSLLPVLFPRDQVPRAMGIASAGMLLGFPLGPVLGGFLLDHFWWGAALLVNVPIVAVTILVCVVALPESRDPDQPRFAPMPTGVAILGLASFVYGVIEIPAHGWISGYVLVPVIGGLLLLAGFTFHQTNARAPMVDFGLFTDRNFLWGTVTAVYVSLALAGLLFVLPQYLQIVHSLTAFTAGAAVLPFTIGMIAGAQLGPAVVKRAGIRVAIVVGLAALAVGFGLGSATGPGSGLWFLSLWTVIAGIGTGAAMVPAMTVIVLTLPSASAGVGSALNQTLRGAATALGVAALGSVVSAVSGATRPGAASSAAFVAGMDAVLLVCAVGAVITAALTITFLTTRDTAATETTESEHEYAGTA